MFYIFNVLYFVHSHYCDKSVMTVIFLVRDSDFRIYDCHLLYFDCELTHFDRDVSTYDSHSA